MNGFRLIVFSDVHDRNGLGLELIDEDGEQVAEVFRDDDRGTTVVRTLRDEGAPIAALQWLLGEAAEAL